MIKLTSAIVISAYFAAALFVFPGFAPPIAAELALAKGDRLPTRSVAPSCSQQMWPNLSLTCLHGSGPIHEARLISVRG